MHAVGRLLARHLKNTSPGKLEWIGIRPARKAPMRSLDTVEARTGLGLAGDHRCDKTPGSARQVTLINQEHLITIAHLMKQQPPVAPELLRRNLVVSGINLMALRHRRFKVGEVTFEATAQCHPCGRMEQALGRGAVAAMLGHGGICARILNDGTINVGDSVSLIDE